MRRAVIAIVDSSHARIFTYQKLDDADQDAALREVRDLVNTGRQAHGRFTDSMPQAPGQPFHFGDKDDHRSDNLANQDMQFAKIVIDEIERVVREQELGRVILVASPKMLGELRRLHEPLRHNGEVVIDEIAQDLAWLTAPQLHDHLAAMKLIDPRPRVAQVRGARTSR